MSYMFALNDARALRVIVRLMALYGHDNNFAHFFGRLLQYKTLGKPFVGLYLELCNGHSHKKEARAKPQYVRTGIATS